jgi:hypothetical protein
MYLRTTQRRNQDGSVVRYYALAENARDPETGQVRARVVHSFGRADRLDRAALERLVASIRRVLGEDAEAGAVGTSLGKDLVIEEVFELGVVHAVRSLWDQLGIGDAIAARLDTKPAAAAYLAALLAMTLQRLDRPGSKLAGFERLPERLWLPEARELKLGQLYRALDVLAEHGAAIEAELFWRSADLFQLDVDLVFYDATTAWFETDDEDVATHEWRGLTFAPLRKRGHSKEGRDNDAQIVVALAVTRDGVPVRSWVFPGNTPDVATVEQVKADLRDMRLGRTLFVGDAGLYGKRQLDALAKGAGRYVLATPIRRIAEIRDEVLSHPGRYADIAPGLRAKEVVLGRGERRRRYILCLNQDEAERERRRRDELLAQLEVELERLGADHPKAACRLLASRRFGPYLAQDADGRPVIDRDKVRRAAHLDGKFVLTTACGAWGPRTPRGDDTLSAADIALGYKGMWIIESCFRRMKTTGLEVRPMFHWMPRRITAHVKLCVLALMIQRRAELATDLTWRRLHDLLEPIKAVRWRSGERGIVQSSKIGADARDLFKKLGISTPKPILASD